MREEQTIYGSADSNGSSPERCCISWTGGKDCNLALLDCWRDPSLFVTDLVVFQPASSNNSFEAHPKRIMQAQAESLGLPLRIMTLPSEISSRDGYLNAITKLRDEYGIQVICTGDMDLIEIEGSKERNWIAECCEMVEAAGGGSIRAHLPLWKADRTVCLRKLIDEGFEVIFSCVKSPWFDASWCGRRLDEDALDQMTEMSKGPLYDKAEMVNWGMKDPRRIPLDLGGENGEYHSMVLDGPLYQNRIELVVVPAEIGLKNNVNDNNSSTDDDNKNTTPITFFSSSSSSFIPHAVVTEPAANGVEDRWWTYNGQTRWSLPPMTSFGSNVVVRRRPKAWGGKNKCEIYGVT